MMDNASAHSWAHIDYHLVDVRKLLPYSQFLNIVENFSSIRKTGVERRLAENNENFMNQPHVHRMATLAIVAEVTIGDSILAHATACLEKIARLL